MCLFRPKKIIEHHKEDSTSAIENAVKAVRIEVTKACKVVESQKKSLNETIETGKAHTKCKYCF